MICDRTALLRCLALASGGVLAALVLALMASATVAEPHRCGGLDVAIESTDPNLATRACGALDRVAPLYRSCGLLAERPPVIRMEIGARPETMQCLGVFHCDENLVRIMSPDRFDSALDPESAFREISPMALFESLVVHEVTHALVHGARGGEGRTLAESEYIAYALQLRSMPDAVRERLLDRVSLQTPVRLEQLSEKALMFSPNEFAIGALLHFEAAGHGCGFVERVLNDEVNFSDR